MKTLKQDGVFGISTAPYFNYHVEPLVIAPTICLEPLASFHKISPFSQLNQF